MNDTNDKLNEEIKKLDRSIIADLEHSLVLAFVTGLFLGTALGVHLARHASWL